MSGETNVVLSENAVFPPNKQLEVVLEFSKTPVIYPHLFYLDINENGESILGASNVTGTFWEGCVLHFKNTQDLQNLNYSGYYIYSTTSDAKFLSNNIIAVAEDTCVLTILSIREDSGLQPTHYFKHFERIPQISVWKNTSNVLTCSGRSITIWDVNSMEKKPLCDYINYHLEFVTSVDALKSDSSIFASAAMDKKCCIWDIRSQNPALVVYSNEFSTLNSISWNQSSPNYLITGSEAGDIYMLDRRQLNSFVSTLHCFDTCIHRTVFNESNQVAICGDVNEVLVVNSENQVFTKCYTSDLHKSFVKGLKWKDNKTLYSCGFEKQIICHQIKLD